MKSMIFKIFTIVAIAVGIIFTACKKDVTPDSSTETVSYDSYNNDEVSNSGTFSATRCPFCDNCVLYVRCKLPKLPTGLTSYASKKKICNAWSPVAGYAVVMPSASYPGNGHIAYVQSVNSNGTITISEGNFNGNCNTRTKTPSQLSVYGYWKP
jgi:hypothetical protein